MTLVDAGLTSPRAKKRPLTFHPTASSPTDEKGLQTPGSRGPRDYNDFRSGIFLPTDSAEEPKILAIAEEAGAGEIAYSLKILISEHVLRMAAAGQNPETGQFETLEYVTHGPTAVLLTTTADDADLDAELLNRCLVLRVNESPEQTAAILARQRARWTAAGQHALDARAAIERRHQHAQQLLERRRVVIPFAEELSFISQLPRHRRDQAKYLNLIACVALLHQHQREVRDFDGLTAIVATALDVAIANALIAPVLGRSIGGMPGRTLELLEFLDGYVEERAAAAQVSRHAVQFTRRELREACEWSDTALKVHLARLVEWEIVEQAGGSPGRCARYTLHYTQVDRERHRIDLELIDPAKLDPSYDADGHWSGLLATWSGVGQGLVRPRSGVGQGTENGESLVKHEANADSGENPAKTRIYGKKTDGPLRASYPDADRDAEAAEGAA